MLPIDKYVLFVMSLEKFGLNCATKIHRRKLKVKRSLYGTETYSSAAIFRFAQVSMFSSKSLLSSLLINVNKHVWHHQTEVFQTE